jgi:hypothetical protein
LVQPNILAYAMLAVWPLVVWQLYRRLDPGRALIWTVLAGYLVLPPLAAFDLPVVPNLDKDVIPALSAAVITLFLLREQPSLLPQNWIGKAMAAAFVISPFATVLTNPDPIPIEYAPDIPGMTLYDSVSAVATEALLFLPFILARHHLATPAAMRTLLAALVTAGLVYSVPMLLESRLSPQTNVWIYGYFQHDFSQTIRFGGYRPVVFLPHGLWVAFFALMCLAAAAVALREGPAVARPKQLAVFLYLAALLVLCRSFGPFAYAMAMLPLILLAPARLQVLAGAGVAVIVIAYPLLRGAHLVPVQEIIDLAYSISPDRGWSLQFRVQNEEQLLARAAERPWFGWGGYARNLIHDPLTGRIWTISDGHWIIRIGTYGWLGYLAEFGLLCLPLWLLAREAWARGAEVTLPAAAVALVYAFNLADLLPNATIVPLTWLMAGALLGWAEAMRTARKARVRDRWNRRYNPGPGRTVI